MWCKCGLKEEKTRKRLNHSFWEGEMPPETRSRQSGLPLAPFLNVGKVLYLSGCPDLHLARPAHQARPQTTPSIPFTACRLHADCPPAFYDQIVHSRQTLTQPPPRKTSPFCCPSCAVCRHAKHEPTSAVVSRIHPQCWLYDLVSLHHYS